MDQFVIWRLRGVTMLCLRSDNPADYYFLQPIKRL